MQLADKMQFGPIEDQKREEACSNAVCVQIHATKSIIRDLSQTFFVFEL